MPLRVHNTLSGRVEDLVPLEPGTIRMYVCGVTVYDLCHIGHARALVTFDVIARYLRFAGFRVTFVRNLTDVDDKIIRRALDQGRTPQEVAEENIRAFHEDVQRLQCLPPDHEPRATHHIADMIELIRELEAKGLAYRIGGDVYFSVESFPQYGKLSKRRLQDLQAGARIDVDDRKRHPMDFVLWKASKPGEPSWDSPWGPGRPGWHIECSAMSTRYLGQPFDIHGGGADLIFPHHENEIAQSEGARGIEFARYWLHNGMVTVAHEKMSKSLGNFLTVREAAGRYGGEALRMFVLGTHYRSPLDYTEERLDECRRALDRVYETLARADRELARHPDTVPEPGVAETIVEEFRAGMDDDFNTARGLATLFDAVRALNRHLDAEDWSRAEGCRRGVREIGRVLGIATHDPAEVLDRARHARLQAAGLSLEELHRLIEERAAARKARDFARADAIREDLRRRGVVLKDGPDGTDWDVAVE